MSRIKASKRFKKETRWKIWWKEESKRKRRKEDKKSMNMVRGVRRERDLTKKIRGLTI